MRFAILFLACAAGLRVGTSVPPRPASRSSSVELLDNASCTLQAFLAQLAPLGPKRAIAVLPGGGAILEATSDSAAWELKTTVMPSGKTLLTAALPDTTGVAGPSFELHVDVAKAVKATLAISPKTGGPIVRLLDAEGGALLTLLPNKANLGKFEALAESYEGEVQLAQPEA